YAGLGRGTNNGDVYVYNGSSWSLSKDFGASIDAIKALATYNGKLYAGLSESAGDGDIWVYDGSNWTISEDNDSTLKKVGSMTVYNGKLYAGIGGDGSTKNSEIHVFDGNTWSIASNFQANTFENIAVTGVNSMAVYNNRLYMGTGDLNGQGDVYVFDGYNWSKSRNETSSQRNPALTVYNGKLYSGSESSNPNEAKIWVYYEREESQLANNNFKNIGAWQEQYQNLTKNLTVMGNVGIGTTSPYTSLAVAGASGVLANIFTATSTTATSTFTGGATFATGGGNVGIGRTVPLVTLDVNGTTFINATNDGSTGAKLVVGGSGTTIYTPGTIWAATNYIGSNDTSLNRALVGGGSVLTTSVPIQLVNSGPILSFYSANTIKVLQGDNLTIGNLMAGTIYGGTTTNAILTLAGTANGSPSGANIVLNGTGQGSVGIGTTSPYAKLSVVGTVVATDYHATSSTLDYQTDNLLNSITTLSTNINNNIIRTPSDISLKENVVPLTNSLDRLLKLQGVSYDWKDKERFGNTKEIGFVAQQVESIVPEVVKGGSYKSLNYGNMVALVVEAVKELNTKVDAISTRLDSIQESLKNMVFDRFTAKIAYIDQIDVKKLNAVDASFSGVVTNDADVLFNKGTHFSSDVCVDNVCVTKDQFKAMLLQGGATTYGSAADQMKGINPLTANLIQATTPTEGVPTTTPTIATTTTPIETATSTTEAIVTPIPVESTPAPVASTSTPAVTETPVIVPEPVVTPVSPSPTDAATSTAN
ncbi:MAG: tail fiber domain-containing protein, partial [Candidatus Taylorbacteria bacterium]|nr:tail fiber domain-containing protein [Candidatus Taylorbacteria bacterium]